MILNLTHLNKHPEGSDDKGEEGARPVELVDDLGAVDGIGGAGGAVVEPLDDVARLVDGLKVGDEDEAGGGEGAQQEGAAVE